jgi:quinol monooxygenase YgiN
MIVCPCQKETAMISVSVTYLVKKESADSFFARIQKHAKTSFEKEGGCLFFDVGRSLDDLDQFFVYEIYKDQSAIDEHRGSDHAKSFLEDVSEMLLERDVTIWHRSGSVDV